MPKKPKLPPKLLTPKEIKKAAQENWLKGRRAEKAYQRQLTTVGKNIGALVKGYAPNGIVTDIPGLTTALHKYSELLKPWAKTVTERMHADVERRDKDAWVQAARQMGKTLRNDLFTHNQVSEMMRSALSIQVKLITSLPIEAAERVQKIALENIVTSSRGEELQKQILASGHVSVGRAKLIARTETSRTASLLMQSRATYIGSEFYHWRTVQDSDVRREHRALEGKVIPWKKPPIAGTNGMRYHAGQGPNCRCYCEPILPD